MSLSGRPFERLVRHGTTYALGDVLVRAAGFLLIPLLTRELTLETFGVLGLVQMLDTVLVLTLSLGMPTAIMRRVAGDPDGEERADTFTAFVSVTLVSVIFLSLLLAASDFLTGVLFDGRIDRSSFALVLAGVGFGTLKLFCVALMRAEGRAGLYVAVNLVHFVLLLTASIAFVAWLDMGLRGAVAAVPVASGAAFLLTLPFLVRRMEPRWHARGLGSLLSYGLPLMPGMVAMWLITMSNRFFIQELRDVADVGIYTLAHRLALPIQVGIVSPFRTAWLPVLFSIRGRDEIDRVAALALAYLTAIASFAALAIALFAPELIGLIATDAYRPAANTVRLLVLAFVIHGLYVNFDNGVLLGRRTAIYPRVVGGAAALAIALNVALIPRFGTEGAATATVLAYVFLALVMGAASSRVHPIRYDLRRALAPLGLAVGLYLIGARLEGSGAIAVKVALIFAHPVALLAFGFSRADERRRLRELITLHRSRSG